jgi:hypothetical protein
MLRRMLGLKGGDITVEWREIQMKALHSLYSPPSNLILFTEL